MKWKKDTKLLLFVALAVIAVYAIYIFITVPYVDKKEKEEDAAIKEYWSDKCYIQIVNKTDHKVSITLYGHENGRVMTMDYQIPAHGQVMLREDMVYDDIREFPPKEMVDSALMVFDDTLCLWQIPALDKASIADHHSLYERFDWENTSIVVREEQTRPSHRPRLYRYGKEFVLTDLDYERAMGIKRYRGQIFHERE